MKKIILVVFLLFFCLYFYLYLVRWNYRNDQSTMGRIVYTLFELNTFKSDIKREDVTVFWSGYDKQGIKKIKALIYYKGESYISNIEGSYGSNAISVYFGKKEVASFSYMHNPWWETNDYELIIKNNRVILKIDNRLMKNQLRDR